MSRVFASLALLLTAAVAANAADPPARTTLSIRWHGQSFFEITTTKGTNIVFDPHAIEDYPRVAVKADLLLMSHFHDDHTQTHVVENLKSLKEGETIFNALKKVGDKEDWNPVDKTIKDVHFRDVGLYHDESKGMKRGKNGAWVIEADGLKIVHLGDLGHLLTEEQLKKIGEVDILLIPVGGVYTINGVDAQKVVEQIKPRHYVIPMHYGTSTYNKLLKEDAFLTDMPITRINRPGGNELLVDPAEKPKEEPVIVILGYEKRGK